MFLENHPDHLKRKPQQPFFPKKKLEINDTKTAQEGPKVCLYHSLRIRNKKAIAALNESVLWPFSVYLPNTIRLISFNLFKASIGVRLLISR